MLHFIRPWYLLGLIPTLLLAMYLLKAKKDTVLSPWTKVCDKTLLFHLMQKESTRFKHNHVFWLFIISLFFLFFAAAGPAFKRLPHITSMVVHPKVILLDLSPHMLAQDVSPNRLERAKLAIYDLANDPRLAPIGMLAYTSEPFMVSPLTEDAQTISALLPTLDTETPPVGGQNLTIALHEAEKLIQDAHFQWGSLLVLTGSSPSEKAIETARALAAKGYTLSVLPLMQTTPSEAFQAFAQAGNGLVLSLPHQAEDLKKWNHFSNHQHSQKGGFARIPEWEDMGLWFVIPVLFLMLPLFRRGVLYG